MYSECGRYIPSDDASVRGRTTSMAKPRSTREQLSFRYMVDANDLCNRGGQQAPSKLQEQIRQRFRYIQSVCVNILTLFSGKPFAVKTY